MRRGFLFRNGIVEQSFIQYTDDKAFGIGVQAGDEIYVIADDALPLDEFSQIMGGEPWTEADIKTLIPTPLRSAVIPNLPPEANTEMLYESPPGGGTGHVIRRDILPPEAPSRVRQRLRDRTVRVAGVDHPPAEPVILHVFSEGAP